MVVDEGWDGGEDRIGCAADARAGWRDDLHLADLAPLHAIRHRTIFRKKISGSIPAPRPSAVWAIRTEGQHHEPAIPS